MIPQLQRFGFTRNEANVYVAGLKLGNCTIQQIANETGLNRITVHSIIEKFEGLQIFIRSYEGKRRRVSAVSPAWLESLLKRKEREVQQERQALKEVFPSLQELYRRMQRGVQVSTFSDEKGYEEICEDVLTAKTEILEYANIDELNKVIGPYIAKDYLPRKHRLQIPTKFLFVDSSSARTYIKKNYLDYPGAAPMEVKFIDPKEFSLDAFFVIYDDKLAILTPATLSGIIIQDKAISDSLRPFFHFVWSRAGEGVKNF
ncbi:MAG: helix-turn-helix domain-containing protein [Patescibacteria group bacterium]